QLAFRITSYSGPVKQIIYHDNEITGFNRGVDWMGDPFGTYTALDFPSGGAPVVIENNIINQAVHGITVRKGEGSTSTESPAFITNNSFTAIDSFAIVYDGSTGVTNAPCNWYAT